MTHIRYYTASSFIKEDTMPLWPEQGTDHDGVDWDAYRRKTARPGSLTDEERKVRDSEEVAKEPSRRTNRSSEV